MNESTAPPRWPEIVGFRHEVLHTGALAALLDGPRGAEVATGLTGRPTVQVANVVSEPRIGPGSRRRADLGFETELADGTLARVLVEIKVDSQATPEQLRDMRRGVGADARCVYLVVGYADSLLPLEHRVFADHDVRVIDLGRWAGLLSGVAEDGDLASYRECIQHEQERRQRLASAVRTTTEGVGDGWRAGGWGPRVVWMGQLRDELSVTDVAWRDRAWSRVSGHDVLFGREFPGWRVDDLHAGHANIYCDVHANADARWLALKTGGASAPRRGSIDIHELRRRVRTSSDMWLSNNRRPGARAITATAATLPLDGLTPRAAAERVASAVGALHGVVEDLLPS